MVTHQISLRQLFKNQRYFWKWLEISMIKRYLNGASSTITMFIQYGLLKEFINIQLFAWQKLRKVHHY